MNLFRERTKAIEIQSTLPPSEIIRRLSTQIAKPTKWYTFKWFTWQSDHNKPYEGKIINNCFYLTSMSDYSKVKGKIETNSSGSLIKLRIIPEPLLRPVTFTSDYKICGFPLQTVGSFAFGIGALVISALFAAIYIFDPTPKLMLLIAALLFIAFCFVIGTYIRVYEKLIDVRIDRNIELINGLLTPNKF